MNAAAGLPPSALLGARDDIRRIPLENISTLARGAFGDPSIIPLWFGEGDVPAPAFIGEAMAGAIAEARCSTPTRTASPLCARRWRAT